MLLSDQKSMLSGHTNKSIQVVAKFGLCAAVSPPRRAPMPRSPGFPFQFLQNGSRLSPDIVKSDEFQTYFLKNSALCQGNVLDYLPALSFFLSSQALRVTWDGGNSWHPSITTVTMCLLYFIDSRVRKITIEASSQGRRRIYSRNVHFYYVFVSLAPSGSI